MKKLIAILAAAILLVSGAVWLLGPDVAVANDGTTFVLGTIPARSAYEHTFTLTNTDRVDWKIAGVTTSCGCTVATPDKEVLRPGETLNLPVRVSAADNDGPFSHDISVLVNSDKLVKFRVSGYAVRELPSMVSLTAETPEREFLFRSMGGRAVNVKSATIDDKLVVMSHQRDGGDEKFTVRMRDGLRPGKHIVELAIETSDPKTPRRVVPIEVYVRDHIVLKNDLFSVGVLGKIEKSFSFDVLSTRGRQIKIDSSTSSPGALVSARGGKVTVTVIGNDNGAIIEEEVSLTASDGESSRTFKVMIYGVGKKSTGVHTG